MDFSAITLADFYTDMYKLAGTSQRYKLLPHLDGFIKDKNEIKLFNKNLLDKYIDKYQKITLFDCSPKEYIAFKGLKHKHTCKYNHITIAKFDGDFFQLKGGSLQRFRYRKRFYTERTRITIKESAPTENIIAFIREWEQIRKDVHFQMLVGYDINYFKNYWQKFANKTVVRFFYDKEKMVGYSVIERVNKNIYNLLFRKVNTNYEDLCLFVDYTMYELIWKQVQEPFLVNLGGDIGKSGILGYKKKFPVFKIIESINVKVLSKVNIPQPQLQFST